MHPSGRMPFRPRTTGVRGRSRCHVVAAVAIGALLLTAAPASAATGFVADQTLATGADVDAPVVAFAPNGYGVVAWVERLPAATSAVRVSVRAPGGAWSDPQQLDVSTRSKSDLGVAVDAGGDAAVVWEQSVPPSTFDVAVATRPPGRPFGAVDSLSDPRAQTNAPAIGIDGSGQVTLAYNHHPDRSVIAFGAGGSPLAARPQVLGEGCGGGPVQLAVAPAGDAVMSFDCDGAGFALRRSAAWTVSPVIANSGGTCSGIGGSVASTTFSTLPVAIDDAGDAAGLVLRTDATRQCDGFPDTNVSSRLSVVTPHVGQMMQAPTPLAFGSSFVGTPGSAPIGVPQIGIGGGSSLVSWVASTASGAQLTVRALAADGTPAGPAAPVGDLVSGVLAPSLAVGADGRALLAWAQRPVDGRDALLASERPPGASFGATVLVSEAGGAGGSAAAAIDDAGDGVVVYRQKSGSLNLPHARGYDATPPALSEVAIPPAATTGVPVAFRASATDFWGPVSLAWSFGDGATGEGAAPVHAFGVAGPLDVTVTATDAVGNAVAQTGTVQVSAPAGGPLPGGGSPRAGGSPGDRSLGRPGPQPPVLSKVRLSPRAFRVGPRATAVAARKRHGHDRGQALPQAQRRAAKRRPARPPIGTTLRFALDRAATVTFAFERKATGRRSGQRCVAPATRLAKRRRCSRWAALKPSLVRGARAGGGRLAFSGRLGRTKLAAGSYRVTLVPRAGELRGTPRTLPFTMVR